ncbi:MAG TPA: twin-arginine translocase TatA/TatE family subunit [Gaiellaceae bacterium]|jgi:sec-independent protein translocase protein TatA|nr:twin-arginine translocase TatA/TatE family subunit [Gaiellaceae bacterium]
MPFGVSVWEILILLLVALLIFGPKRLPEMGRSLGKGMREFKDSVTGRDDEDERRELPASREEPSATVAAAPPRERDSVS